jgi:NADPH:quinone reductase-like Zn-dependent oxidoreductase
MKAMAFFEFGAPELIREWELAAPEPAEGEVLVRVIASSVNPADWKIGAGALRGLIDYPLPFIPGMDFSGVVTAVGAKVTDVEIGDRVFGATSLQRLGTYAELVAVPAAMVAKAPDSMPLASAAAVPLAALTAWYAILGDQHGNVQGGQSVLIHGGAGGTGMFAVQFARWRGARVIATASGANLPFLRSLGADEAIDYRTTRFEEVTGELDAVIDLVGGDVQARSIPLLRKGGVLTSIVSNPDQELARQHGIKATFLAGARDRNVLMQMAHLIDTGTVRAVISEEFDLADAGRALAKSSEGHVRGKIVLRIGDEK